MKLKLLLLLVLSILSNLKLEARFNPWGAAALGVAGGVIAAKALSRPKYSQVEVYEQPVYYSDDYYDDGYYGDYNTDYYYDYEPVVRKRVVTNRPYKRVRTVRKETTPVYTAKRRRVNLDEPVYTAKRRRIDLDKKDNMTRGSTKTVVTKKAIHDDADLM